MSHASHSASPRRIAVTGASGNLGSLLLPLLLGDADIETVLAIDLHRPESVHPKLGYRHVDLVRHDAEAVLGDIFRHERVDAVYHLAFHLSGGRGSFAHELEVMGTLQVLAAVASAKVPRLIVASSTALYGARGQHPAYITEDAPLLGCPNSRFVQDKVVVEEQVRAFRKSHPGTRVVVLRLAPLVGPDCDNPFTRLLGSDRVPTLLGFDPLFQVVHQDDAMRAMHLALRADVSGEFNIVGDGVMSFSGLVRQAGKRPLPLPQPMAVAAIRALNISGMFNLPPSLLSYLHYSWTADGERAATQLGYRPRHHVRDAVKTLKRG